MAITGVQTPPLAKLLVAVDSFVAAHDALRRGACIVGFIVCFQLLRRRG
jgi:hypothetical protein